MKIQYKGLPLAVVIDGKIQKYNLKLINKNEKWLKQELMAKGYDQIKDIFYASVKDTDHSLVVNTFNVID